MLDNARPYSDNDKFYDEFINNPVLMTKKVMLSSSAIEDAAFDSIEAGKMQFKFSKEIKTMAVTNQKQSGRCWLFACMNVLREKTAKMLNLDSFELSQNYVAFYDKLEKANYFLESIIDTADKDIDDRTVSCILQTGIQDGGQWDMAVALINKYGVVPKSAMPETKLSSQTGKMNSILNMQLREYASILRTLKKEGKDTASVKDKMLQSIYNALVLCFGQPPKCFDFEYVDKDGKYHVDRDLNGKEFFKKYVDIDLSEYVSLINSPTEDKPFDRTFTVKYLGNVIEADKVHYYNVSMDKLKKYILKQLDNDEIVWFGSDVGKFGNRDLGIWDKDCFAFDKILDLSLTISKEDQLNYRDSAMNHAMVITGYNIGKDGEPDRWKIENSWSDERGCKGYYVMGKEWFDQYVYQAVINKKYLDTEDLAKLDLEPIELNPWDPMGSLAD